MENVLTYIKWGIAGLSALLTYLFGGFDMILTILLAFVVIDYITGVVGAFCNHNVSSEVAPLMRPDTNHLQAPSIQ